MSRTGWKQAERIVAQKIGGHRYWGNSGGLVDVESRQLVIQVKERRTLSLTQLEALLLSIRSVAKARGRVTPGVLGLVAVKRSARKPTPWLAVVDLDDLLALMLGDGR